MKLSNFKALTFDCYGTLIDWETGIFEGIHPLVAKAGLDLTRNQILEAHAFHESTHQKQTPGRKYQELLASVYRRLAEEWNVEVSWQECLAYGQTVKSWPAFPDSGAALQYLKKHFVLVILSNVDNDTFAYSNARLGVHFDGIMTAEDIGSYKPSDRNFEYLKMMMARREIEPGEILHTADSLFHDHEPARRHGLTSCRIFRRRGMEGNGAAMNPARTPECAFCFDSMMDLARAHEAEMVS